MLFKVEKLKEQPKTELATSGLVDDTVHIHPGSMALDEIIALVDHGKTVHWVTEGSWSMHQLLAKLLELTGPAEAFISSYAFSELPARTIADLVDTGMIQKLYCVLDSRIDVRSASALTMIKNKATQLKLTKTHAKVTVLKNKDWFLVVVGSANYTTNVRYEAGFISVDATNSIFHRNWIIKELNKPS